MEFKIGSIILRKPTLDDADGFIEICKEKETMKYYGIAGAQIDTKEKAINQINWCNSLFSNNSGRWIITEDMNDRYIGDIGFHNFQEEHHKAEIGFRLKKDYWGKGIVPACINELIRYGFEELNYNRIEALVDSRNENSKKALLKSHFVCEGTLREYELEFGQYIDLDVFSILRREYLANEKCQ
jgi:ribosomal-protein-alanine N-acetyltransferase